jgi:hypothetical protein
MIRLLPINTVQTISIMPRNREVLSGIDVVINKEGSNETEVLTGLTAVEAGNFVELDIQSNFLEEGASYFAIFMVGNDLWFRDKIFITAQEKDNKKHKLDKDAYQEYESPNSGEYTIV